MNYQTNKYNELILILLFQQFLAAVNQAGLVKEIEYEFTSKERIFEKRFESFHIIPQPPPLTYKDYLQGSDFSKVSQNELLRSTSECFSQSKLMVDSLVAQIPSLDVDYLAVHDKQLHQYTKICVGNSVYIRKLSQIIEGKGTSEASVSVEIEPAIQFCTIKLS